MLAQLVPLVRLLLVLAIVAQQIAPAVAHADAVSREASAYNNLEEMPQVNSAESREVALFNSTKGPYQVSDAVSREVALFNNTKGVYQISDASSREISLFNNTKGPYQQFDAVSRELALFNDATVTVTGVDAVSREVALFNDTKGATLVADAVSREVAVFNNVLGPSVQTDAVSREVALFNSILGPSMHTDAVSREVAVFNRIDFPDLAVVALAAPSVAWSGEDVEVNFTVANLGPVAVAIPWEDRVYLSSDDSLSSDDELLLASTFFGGLGAGETAERSVAVAMPIGVKGDFWLFVCADGGNAVAEGDEENNCFLSGSPLHINLSPFPDLVVSSVEAPTATSAGATIDINWAIENQGTGATNASVWLDSIYLSEDEELDGTDFALGEFENLTYLQPDEGYSQQDVEVTMPWGIAGSYHVLVETDARDDLYEHSGEGNNVRASDALSVSFEIEPGPDMCVHALVSPSVGRAGDPIEISYKLINIGPEPAIGGNSYWDFLMLSQDQLIGDDERIGIVRFHTPAVISPGDTVFVTRTVDLPSTAEGVNFAYVRSDTRLINNDQNLGNNFSDLREIDITPIQPADLEVVDFVVEPTTVASGDALSIDYTVQNNGLGRTRIIAWKDRVKLSIDDTPSPDDLVLLDVVPPITTFLDVGESYNVSALAPVASGVAGTFTAFVCADADSQVVETDDSDNCEAFGTAVLVESFLPDLRPTTLIVPSSVSSGDVVDLQAYIGNLGPGNAVPGGWLDELYLSDDALLSAGDVHLFEARREGDLSAGTSYDVLASVQIPEGVEGAKFFLVTTDANDELPEVDTGNNVLAKAVLVELTPPPDLVVSDLDVVGSPLAGLPLSVNWQVTNQGTGLAGAAGGWRDALYLSEDAVLGAGDTLLAFVQHPTAVPAGGGYGASVTVELPDSAGDYHLLCKADDRDAVYEHGLEDNNVLALPLSVQPRPQSDLTVVAVEGFSPEVGLSTVVWTVRNVGGATVATTWIDQLYVSEDPELDRNLDHLLGSFSRVGALGGGDEYEQERSVVVPPEVAGDRHLFVVCDAGEQLDELNETNNVASAPVTIVLPEIDLVPEGIELPPVAMSGQTYEVSWTARNRGEDLLPESTWVDAVYLSLDQFLDSSDLLAASTTHSMSLSPGEDYGVTAEAQLPLGLVGNYFVFLEIDQRDDVFEPGVEQNNVLLRMDPIEVVLPEPVDLLVTEVGVPAGAIAGDSLEVSWTVRNESDNTVAGRWLDGVFVSEDEVWGLEDPAVGTVQQSGSVGPGGEQHFAARFAVEEFLGALESLTPGVLPGTYHIVVRTDLHNEIFESDVTNNTGVSVAEVQVDVRELGIGGTLDDDVVAYGRRYFVVDPGPTDDVRLDFEVSSGSAVEVFTRNGFVPDRLRFDDRAEVQGSASASWVVPGGDLVYVMVRGLGPAESSFTIAATAEGFGISEYFPSRIGHDGRVTVSLAGAGFRDGMAVELQMGGNVIPAADVSVKRSIEARATFFMEEAVLGEYSVRATGPDGALRVASTPMVVEPAVRAQPDVVLSGPGARREGQESVVLCSVQNVGNVDLEYVLGGFLLDDPNVEVEVSSDRMWKISEDVTTIVGLDQSLPGVRDDEETGYFYIVRDLTVGEEAEFVLKVGPTADDVVVVGFAEDRPAEAFRGGVEAAAERLRQTVLGSPDEFPVEIVALAQSADEWLEEFVSAVREIGLLDARQVTGVDVTGIGGGGAEGDLGEQLVCFLLCSFQTTVHCAMMRACYAAGAAPPAAFACAVAVTLLCWWHEEYVCEQVLDCGCVDVPGGKGAKICMHNVAPHDPNEKIGPTPEEQPLVPAGRPLSYIVHFENVPTASAPAQEVIVRDQLVDEFDIGSVRFGDIAFGDSLLVIESGSAYFQRTITLEDPYLLIVTASVNAATRNLEWKFETIDSRTGLPPQDPLAGFLPPNDDSGRGAGFVSYDVEISNNITAGTGVTNIASITFDTNEPILTNDVLNIVSGAAPDLTPTSVSEEVGPLGGVEGEPRVVNVVVANVGDALSPGFGVELRLDSASGLVVGVADVLGSTGSGDTRPIQIPWTPVGWQGEREIVVVVDPDDRIVEGDELNNSAALTVPVAPRAFARPVVEGVNVVSLPLSPEEPFVASTFAEALGATMLVRADSSGTFQTFVADPPMGIDFDVEPARGYIAVVGSGGTVVFEGTTNPPAMLITSGANLVGLPVDPGNSYSAKRLSEAVGASVVARYVPEAGRFEPYVRAVHGDPGFALSGGEGYVVVADADTTVAFSGVGWHEPSVPLRGVAKTMPGDTESKPSSSAVLGVVGTVSISSGQATAVADDGWVGVASTSGHRVQTSLVDGHYGAAFLDFGGGTPFSAGDSLVAEVHLSSGDVVAANAVMVTSADLDRGYVVIPEVVAIVAPRVTRADRPFPNPFNPSTTVSFQVAEPSHVALRVYSADGRHVRTLADDVMNPGYYQLVWDGRDDSGRQLASGVYFYRFKAGAYTARHKMVLLK